MTCKEICECIYDCFLDFFENIECLTAFILQVLKWIFLVVTSPIWLIPYTIIKQDKKKVQTMAEYIERESLLKEMLGLHSIPVYIGHVTDEDKMFETMVEVVEEHPAADVVPVVRCKDCKHYTNIDTYRNPPRLGFHWCNKLGNITKEKDYCSYGERRCEE